jgi:hypothetical protein
MRHENLHVYSLTFKLRIMKKILIIAIVIMVFSSCKKESTNSAPQEVAATANTFPENSADPSAAHFKIDLTGTTFANGCLNEDMVILSGILSLNTHQDGTIASFNVSDFVLQAADGAIYRGTWVGTFQVTAPQPLPGAFNNTYKVIFTTAGGGNNFLLQGVFHLAENASGQLTVVIDNFTAGCQ